MANLLRNIVEQADEIDTLPNQIILFIFMFIE